jgi:hypothetical protein
MSEEYSVGYSEGYQAGWNAAIDSVPPAVPVQEPVKPYAYEYGRDNGDGTYSVVIDKGSLVQTQPAVYNYVRPQNAHKNWPIKELFDRPPAAQPAPVQEPKFVRVVDGVPCITLAEHKHLIATNQAAAQREWRGLTDEEFIDLCEDASNFGTGSLIRHIEQRLKEKNHHG